MPSSAGAGEGALIFSSLKDAEMVWRRVGDEEGKRSVAVYLCFEKLGTSGLEVWAGEVTVQEFCHCQQLALGETYLPRQ